MTEKKKKENKAIKDRVIRDIGNLFMHEEEDCYKAVRVIFLSKNYNIEYESNVDRNETLSLSVKGYLIKIRPYLKDIINDLKKPDT